MKRFYIFIAFILLTPISTSAALLKSGDQLAVSDTQNIEGNFYGAAGTLDVSGTVNGDAYLLGGTVTVNGPIMDDLVVVGPVVRVAGDISGDARIVGNNVYIEGEVSGDTIIIAENISIEPSAKLAGDVVFYATNVSLNGSVNGSLYGRITTLRIDTVVDGDIELTHVNNLILGAKAKFGGGLTYTSPKEATIAEGVVLPEVITYTPAAAPLIGATFLGIVATALILGFIFYFFTGRQVTILTANSLQHPGMYMLLGIGTFIATPIVIIVLLVTGIGTLVGVFIAAIYVALLIASVAFSIALLGLLTKRILRQPLTVTPLSIVYGAFIISIFSISLLSGLIPLIITIPLGYIIHAFYATLRKKFWKRR